MTAPTVLAGLTEKESLHLAIEVLEFFRATPAHPGRTKRQLWLSRNDFPVVKDELYRLVDCLNALKLVWRRGDGPSTIYATSRLGSEAIPLYRKELESLG